MKGIGKIHLGTGKEHKKRENSKKRLKNSELILACKWEYTSRTALESKQIL